MKCYFDYLDNVLFYDLSWLYDLKSVILWRLILLKSVIFYH